MSKKEFSYNEAVAEIEEILLQLEKDDTDIDELAGKVKRVSSLIKLCRQKLRVTEKEVEKIIDDIQDSDE